MENYEQGWDDCLDEVLHILGSTNDVEKAKAAVESLQLAVKSKKRERIRSELGVFGGLF
ncbi:MAG: hypothetical protein NWF00_04965 [Candidatus Bathyarchaeota archaeon]|nr:hypothetical protein [Candidatus Bathyarchaeota archaeon]